VASFTVKSSCGRGRDEAEEEDNVDVGGDLGYLWCFEAMEGRGGGGGDGVSCKVEVEVESLE
jgi:hypothetical protein